MWRDRIHDLAFITSLTEDLKLFWQLKAMRWDHLEERIRNQIEIEDLLRDPEGKATRSKLRMILKGDEEYQFLKKRIKMQRDEVKKIFQFFRLDIPKPIRKLKFSQPVIDFDVIENAVDTLEEFISFCGTVDYNAYYLQQAWESPKTFFKEAAEHFLEKYFT